MPLPSYLTLKNVYFLGNNNNFHGKLFLSAGRVEDYSRLRLSKKRTANESTAETEIINEAFRKQRINLELKVNPQKNINKCVPADNYN